MKRNSNRRLTLLVAMLLLVLVPITNGQTDAQVLSDFAADVNNGLPKNLGDSQITSTLTFCQFGCQSYFATPVLRLIGRTPRLAKANISPASLGQSIRTALLPDYCKHPARQKNVSIQVYLSDMFGVDLGAVAYLQPSECPAAAATPAQAVSGNAQFLANYAALTRKDLPVTNQGITFWKASTYCPAGCENASSSDFLVIYAKHLSLAKASVPLAQISTFFSPTLTKNYCDNSGGAAQKNVTLLVQLTDSNNDYVGEIARLTPASCQAKSTATAVTPTPAATPKQVHTAESQFLTNWADEIRKDMPFAFGNLEFYESATYCPAGCQHITTGAGFITVVGRTPQLSQTTAGAAPYVPSVKTLFFDKYCDKARNTRYLMMVELVDKGGNYIGRPGSFSPANCPAVPAASIGLPTPAVAAAASSVEQQLWDAVKSSTSAADYQVYLNDFPNGQYASIAKLKIGQLGGTVSQPSVPAPVSSAAQATSSAGKSVEEQYWDAVKNSNRVQDFQSYLNDYPNGQFVPIARLRISQIGGTAANPTPAKTEDQVWAGISSSQRSQDFQDYLNTYPNGKYASIARVRISQLAGAAAVSAPVSTAVEEQYWDNVKNSTRVQDYQSYLNTFPLGRYASLARLKIDQLNAGTGTQTATPAPPTVTAGLSPQMTGTQILSMAQFGNIREMANLGTFWVLTDPNDLRSRQSITDELIKEYPRLSTASSFEDADFYLVFGMTDSSGAIVTDNTNRQNQVFTGEMLVFTSAGSSNGLPAIRILFRSAKSQSFTQAGISLFQTGPAKATTRDFIKALKKINF